MNYEEKRELRLQISQLIADAGLNQETLKQMVRDEISKKTDRAIEQIVYDIVKDKASKAWSSQLTTTIYRVIKDELKDRVIKVVLEGCETE